MLHLFGTFAFREHDLHRCCPGGGCDGADIRTHKIRLLITPATTNLVRKILTLTKKTTR